MKKGFVKVAAIVPCLLVARMLIADTFAPSQAKSAREWTLFAQLVAPSDDKGVQQFGSTLAAQAGWLFIGANYGTSNSSSVPRVVYVYHRERSGWQKSQVLKVNDGGLGYGIAMGDNVVFIRGYIEKGKNQKNRNFVFIYKEHDGLWQRVAMLQTDADGEMVYRGGDLFIHDEDSGEVTIFGNDGGAWSEVAKVGNQEGPTGTDMAASNSRFIVLSYGHGGFPDGHGEVSVYDVQAMRWTRTATIVPTGEFANYYFTSCAISATGDAIFVVAGLAVPPTRLTSKMKQILAQTVVPMTQRQAMVEKEVVKENASHQISRHVQVLMYRQDRGKWKLVAHGAPTQPALADSFGEVMRFLDGELFVGAPRANITENGYWNGAMYVFKPEDSTLKQIVKLTAGHPDVAESFGSTFARVGNTLIVGAPSAEVNGREQGAVYIFERHVKR